MNDATSTSFGLLIAFLLPGLAGLYAVTFWSADASALFENFLKVHSDVGYFLFMVLAALTVGLFVAMLRSFLFEFWLCRRFKLVGADYAKCLKKIQFGGALQ